jgi:hypothetical protein
MVVMAGIIDLNAEFDDLFGVQVLSFDEELVDLRESFFA